MYDVQSLREVAADVIEKIVIKSYPFLSLGKPISLIMDQFATKEYDRLLQAALNIGYSIQVLSVEGERDGVFCSEMQTFEESSKKPNLIIVVDPIDGTLTGSRGGARCLSVIGISENKKGKSFKKLPDCLSCFSVGSQENNKFLEHLCVNGNKIGLNNFEKDFMTLNISTLHRAETKELFSNLLGLSVEEFEKKYRFSIGERTLYRPNLAYKMIIFVGDTSVSLPLETKNFIGRTGIAEARLESSMWKYWRGLIVSGSKMKRYEGGPIKYLIDRMNCANNQKDIDITSLFEESEMKAMLNYGWKLGEIASFLEKDEFTPEFKLICIASISGTRDRYLKSMQLGNLKPCMFIPEKNSILYETWIVEDGLLKKEKKECIINTINDDKWSKYILDWYKKGSWSEVFARASKHIENSSDQYQVLNFLARLERGESLTKKDVKYAYNELQ